MLQVSLKIQAIPVNNNGPSREQLY